MNTVIFLVAETIEGLDSNLAYFTHREGAMSYRPELFSCEDQAVGRYVKVMIRNTRTGMYCFNEVEVYGSLVTTTTTTSTSTTTQMISTTRTTTMSTTAQSIVSAP